MSDTSANLAMPYLLPSQAQKHVTHNAALDLLDAVVQLSVESRALTVPPALPGDGARYLVAAGATGDWDGQAGQVAVARGGGWAFVAPQPGWLLHDRDTGEVLVFDGSAWARPVPDTDNLAGVGINTGSDLVNRLAVSSPATLLSHDGAGHQLKINKAASAETASLLYQTGWSGRAEIGLAGNDDLALKVSPDGSAWTEALRTEAASGRVIVPQGAEIGGVLTGSAVQAGNLDQTLGVLLTVGAFGLGKGGGLPAPNNDADDCVVPGFNYRFSTSGANCPVANPYGSSLQVFAGTGGNRLQQLFVHSNGSDMWVRSSTDAGASWGTWDQIFTQGSILGAVSESSGTPTGAIFEAGANANGSYEKYASGYMVAWTERLIDVTATGAQTFNLPVTFVSDPAPVVSWCHDGTASPNAALHYSNIEGISVSNTHDSVAINLNSAGVADASAYKDTLRFCVQGRWF
ncbi:DUF2793 domain-containing protein [Mesobacterium sp. TK19101]|uniref:DUF2793 domain-containing protein n=1 Tax=Mesobacterium hydrothermale TaxID=3111907 RepID=A0ABU6HK27_9RHOB|nr:DUF2793 domain-containing protein [Mesobacterium sp. TK19101]MEC3862691.1 DUF2793 domain-containing protein [Mesobacterium sp. TK19101]